MAAISQDSGYEVCQRSNVTYMYLKTLSTYLLNNTNMTAVHGDVFYEVHDVSLCYRTLDNVYPAICNSGVSIFNGSTPNFIFIVLLARVTLYQIYAR